MRAILQRVSRAECTVDGKPVGSIGPGLLVYTGIKTGDTKADAVKLAEKISTLRIFNDPDGKLNLSVIDTAGSILVIPNFTIMGNTRKGRRPSYDKSAPGSEAAVLVKEFVQALRQRVPCVQEGEFGADMTIDSVARGPVNVIVDTS